MASFTNNNGPYGLSDPQRDLLETTNPIIDIVGAIEEPMFWYVRRAIMFLRSRNTPDIEVYITSPGGRVSVGLDIYDLLRLYPGHKTAMVHDRAESMGALILQACDVRKIAKHSAVLIHHISSSNVSLDVIQSVRRLKGMRESMETDQRRLYDVLSTRTGKKATIIKRECAKDRHMTAEEALAFGLVDEIV